MTVAGALLGGLFGASLSGGSILTGATAAGALVGSELGRRVGSALTPKPPVMPSPVTPTPGPTSMQVQAAGRTERERRRKRRGYGSTILAGGELGTATTTRKQILG